MKRIKLKELQRRILLEGVGPTVAFFGAALMEGHLNPSDFSIRDLAEATVMTSQGEPCGREWLAAIDPRRGGAMELMEADGAVDTTAFANLTSQLVFGAVMKAYNAPEFIHTRLAPVRTTRFKSEVIPGIAGIVEDMDDDIPEGMPYPVVGFGEDYRRTPVTKKKGRIVNVTREIILHDQTGLVLEAAKGIGQILSIRDEKDFVRLLLGLVNNFNWRGVAYNTYQTSTPWINVKSSNGITTSDGWAKIDASEQLFSNMKEPNTLEPVTISPDTIVHMPARRHQFRRVTRAETLAASQATSGAHEITTGPNTVDPYELVESRWAYSELVAAGESAANAADYWFHLDKDEAFECIENWPLHVTQAPQNSEAEFVQDILFRFKASRKRSFAVKEPRATVKNYQAATI